MRATIRQVDELVRDYYQVSHLDLSSKSRENKIPFYRSVVTYLLRKAVDRPYNHAFIRDFYRFKNHTTFVHYEHKVAADMMKSRDLKDDVAYLEMQVMLIENPDLSFKMFKKYCIFELSKQESMEDFKSKLERLSNIKVF